MHKGWNGGKNSNEWTKREITELDNCQIRNSNSNSIQANLKQINYAVASQSSKALANIFSCEIFRNLRTADTLPVRSYLDLICEIERHLVLQKSYVSFPSGKHTNLNPAGGARAHLSEPSSNLARTLQTEGVKLETGRKRESEVRFVLDVCIQQERGAVKWRH